MFLGSLAYLRLIYRVRCQDYASTRELVMNKVILHAAVFFAAAWPAGYAAAECGNAATYTAQRPASGQPENQTGIAAAHQSLPLGTRVVVRNQRTGRSIVVRITDRSPSLVGGIIDLTAGALNALGMETLAPVCLEVVSYGSERRGYQKITMRNPFLRAKKPETEARTRGRTHTAAVRHGSGKLSAKLHRRAQPVRGTSHRGQTAARRRA